jgi:hypothetical protein
VVAFFVGEWYRFKSLLKRWQLDNFTIRKYAEIVVWLGFVNMILLFGTIKIYDHVTHEVGELLAIEIEEFQKQNTTFPTEIKSITSKLELNFMESFFADQIDYKVYENKYELEATLIFGKRRKYDQNNSEWK